MEEKKNQIVELICKLLEKRRVTSQHRVSDVSLLAGDGSQRQFFRVRCADDNNIIAVLPSGGHSPEREEARSAWLIGSHLFKMKVPVPEPLADD
ncbi:MAG: hypothetical protein ACWGN1_06470, partial [Desulfobulbales bacterium]